MTSCQHLLMSRIHSLVIVESPAQSLSVHTEHPEHIIQTSSGLERMNTVQAPSSLFSAFHLCVLQRIRPFFFRFFAVRRYKISLF